MTSDELTQMLREILAGQAAPTAESSEVAVIRERMTKEAKDIRARGGVVDIPAELPAPDDNET